MLEAKIKILKIGTFSSLLLCISIPYYSPLLGPSFYLVKFGSELS